MQFIGYFSKQTYDDDENVKINDLRESEKNSEEVNEADGEDSLVKRLGSCCMTAYYCLVPGKKIF